MSLATLLSKDKPPQGVELPVYDVISRMSGFTSSKLIMVREPGLFSRPQYLFGSEAKSQIEQVMQGRDYFSPSGVYYTLIQEGANPPLFTNRFEIPSEHRVYRWS